jgi:hypothetical protein
MQWLKTWMPWSVVVGGIYSPNHQSDRWGGCLSMGAPDSPVRHRTLSDASPGTVRCVTGHFLVRQPRHPTVRVRPLELWQPGAPDSPVPHRTGTVHCPVRLLVPALTLRELSAHCSCVSQPLNLTVAQATVAPLGTSNSPVNYSGGHFPETRS